MFYKKEGLPKLDELVICKVSRITPHTAFVTLEEYKDKEAMLHISEVSSKWVSDIREVLKEGKLIVCKVLKVDEKTGFIDVSLKRVSRTEELIKRDEWKNENRVEKMLEAAASKIGSNLEEAYRAIGYKIIKKYGSLRAIIPEIAEKGEEALRELEVDERWVKSFMDVIEDYLKSSKVSISVLLTLKSFEGDGVLRIRNLFEEISKKCRRSKMEFVFSYFGAPRYRIKLTSNNYKQIEKFLSSLSAEIQNLSKKYGLEIEMKREE